MLICYYLFQTVKSTSNRSVKTSKLSLFCNPVHCVCISVSAVIYTQGVVARGPPTSFIGAIDCSFKLRLS